MEVEIFCTRCDYVRKSFKINKQQVHEADNLIPNKSCQDCKLIVKSCTLNNSKVQTQAESSQDAKPEYISLPNKAFFFHSNKHILYDDGNNKSHVSSSFIGSNEKSQFASIYSTKNVLLIGTGSLKRGPVLQSLKSLTFRKFVCLCNSRTWAFDYFDDWIYAEHENTNEKENTLRAVHEYTNKHKMKFDAVLTYDDYCVLMTSFIANNLNLPSMPFEFIERIKDKGDFRRYCARQKINCPRFLIISSSKRADYLKKISSSIANLKENEKISKEDFSLNFPVIVKNTLGAGKGMSLNK
jgi:hypothetical protein